MTKFKLFKILFFAVIISVVLVGCSSDDDDAQKANEFTGVWICHEGSEYDNELTLFDNGSVHMKERVLGQYYTYTGTYSIQDNKLTMWLKEKDITNTEKVVFTIKSINSKEKLELENQYGSVHTFYHEGYNNTTNGTGSSGSGSAGSGSNNSGSGTSSTAYEKPEIGIEDFTCYTTSLVVKYRIYNQDKAKVTSAKGYYGTSSASTPVSASVAGSLITIRITGLKKGTTYYVKCSASGKGGTTTSERVKLITDF